MKRFYIYIVAALALALFGLLPLRGTDAAELIPVRVLLVESEGNQVRVRCDHGVEGTGRNWELALENLQSSAPGQVFFGTVEHVIVARSARYLLPRLASAGELRPAAKLYDCVQALPEAETAAEFLHAHPGSLTLCRARAAILAGKEPDVPKILETDGRLLLAE